MKLRRADAWSGTGVVPPGWLRARAPGTADDVGTRAESVGGETGWSPTPERRLEVRAFECMVRGGALRFSGQLRVREGGAPVGIDAPVGAELLVQRGSLVLDGTACPPGSYLRLPRGADGAGADGSAGAGAAARRLVLGGESGADALVYLSIGQIEPTDREERIIDTTAPGAWLDGPVPGVEVLPLHGHRTGNVMLVRWTGPAAFRPKLDPTGEELLVLEGTLHDAVGTWPAGSWLRNPVPAWQSWAGSPGTLVCYKSGHFGTLP